MAIRALPLASDLGSWSAAPQTPHALDHDVPHAVRNHDVRMGSVALDLVDSVFEWRTVCIDRIDGPAAWRLWLAESGIPAPAVAIEEAVLDRMRLLREAIFRLASQLTEDVPSSSSSLEVLNALALRPQAGIELRPSATGGFSVVRAALSHEDILAEIARDAVELFGGPRASRVKECSGHRCPTLFFDSSPAGDRRWCSPQCSARAWSSSYRERRRAAKGN